MDTTFQLAAIAGTLGLLWLTLMYLRRLRGPQSSSNRLSVQQRLPLANGCQLILLQWDGQDLLIATGTQPCTVVASKATGPTASLPLAPQKEKSAWAL